MAQDRDIAEKLHALVGARAGPYSEAEVSAPSSPFLLVRRAALEALRRGVEDERGSRIEELEVRIWVVASERRNDRLGGSDDFDGGIERLPRPALLRRTEVIRTRRTPATVKAQIMDSPPPAGYAGRQARRGPPCETRSVTPKPGDAGFCGRLTRRDSTRNCRGGVTAGGRAAARSGRLASTI